jgi:hypothetical protein
LQPDVLTEFPQQLGAKGVDGAAPHRLDATVKLAREALRNLACRLVCESEYADALRCDAKLVDQKSYPLDQAIRLARARTGDDEQRLEWRFDRRALCSRGNACSRRIGTIGYRIRE